MPYCRKCGTKLDENARFCHHCGTPVITPAPASAPYARRPMRRNPFFIPVIILIAIVLSAVIVSAIIFTPFNPVNFNQTNQVSQPNADRLNLDFQADVAAVNVFTNLTDQAVLMDVSAKGSTNIFGSNSPLKITFENSTVNNVLTVNARVTSFEFWPISSNLQVICNIYINPKLNMSLNVRSTVGQVTMNADAPATIEALTLETTTGVTQVNLRKGTAITGDLTLKTTTGTVWFNMDQADVHGNITVNLQSTTGSVNMNITETQKFAGNVQINANTQTGAVNLDRMLIDGEVGARIESHTTLGRITANVQNFSGNQSPIQSNNYPAASNIQVNMNTNIGEIHITATYQTTTIPTIRN